MICVVVVLAEDFKGVLDVGLVFLFIGGRDLLSFLEGYMKKLGFYDNLLFNY